MIHCTCSRTKAPKARTDGLQSCDAPRPLSQCVDKWYFKKPIYTNTRGQQFPFHVSNDPLHADTNSTKAVHVARSESHSMAGLFLCLAPALSRRMPYKAYQAFANICWGVTNGDVERMLWIEDLGDNGKVRIAMREGLSRMCGRAAVTYAT